MRLTAAKKKLLAIGLALGTLCARADGLAAQEHVPAVAPEDKLKAYIVSDHRPLRSKVLDDDDVAYNLKAFYLVKAACRAEFVVLEGIFQNAVVNASGATDEVGSIAEVWYSVKWPDAGAPGSQRCDQNRVGQFEPRNLVLRRLNDGEWFAGAWRRRLVKDQ